MVILFVAGLCGLSLAIWLGLTFARGGFWKSDQRLEPAGERADWPEVVAVIPARNEAPTIGRTVASLLGQDYAGEFQVIVVDDNSDDGTAEAARDAVGQSERLQIVQGKPLEAGWSGKLWAVQQGIEAVSRRIPDVAYVLLTDADIEHAPENLRELVWKAETDGRDLVSLMVLLRAASFWEKLLIPAFVFFFQKLYPFAQVNDPVKRTAAAAGGCILVRRETLDRAGGIASIRNRLIDDCALAAAVKDKGPIWLGLTDRTKSLRAYDHLSEIWNMVARTAFVQLDHSIVNLAGTLVGMVILYLVPPGAMVFGLAGGDAGALTPLIGILGAATWSLMATLYWPTLKLYRMHPLWSLTLPISGFLYSLMTLSSAIRHWRGSGGAWKGRSYSAAGSVDG